MAPDSWVAPVSDSLDAIQLFENPVLERLTHTHFAAPVAIFLLPTAFGLYYGITCNLLTDVAAFGLFGAGLLPFTLAEYAMHRRLYHLAPTTPARARFRHTMHGVHHASLKDKTRLAMPPILTVFVASLLFFLFYFVLGHAAFGVLAGFVFGYASYLLCTTACMCTPRPRMHSNGSGITTPCTTTPRSRLRLASAPRCGTMFLAPCPAAGRGNQLA